MPLRRGSPHTPRLGEASESPVRPSVFAGTVSPPLGSILALSLLVVLTSCSASPGFNVHGVTAFWVSPTTCCSLPEGVQQPALEPKDSMLSPAAPGEEALPWCELHQCWRLPWRLPCAHAGSSPMRALSRLPSKRSSPLQDERLETSGSRPGSPGPRPAVAGEKTLPEFGHHRRREALDPPADSLQGGGRVHRSPSRCLWALYRPRGFS